MNSDSTLAGDAAAAARAARSLAATTKDRNEAAARVAAVISRRARVAGLSDAAYFGEIIAGRAPRVTRAEAALEPLPRPQDEGALPTAT